MSILTSLERAYHRLAEDEKVPPIGYADERIGYCIILNASGRPVGHPVDMRNHTGKKPAAQRKWVPRPAKRTVKIVPNFLWDKTSYSLGVTAAEASGSDSGRDLTDRTVNQYNAFRGHHLEALRETDDEGLIALRRFLEWWRPEQFNELDWPEEMIDSNVVFRLEGERGFIHEREAARRLWISQMQQTYESNQAVCLVTGEKTSIARLHPAIKGVRAAQSSGASLVSFNIDAFESYGHKQGGNAPVSEAAAAAYTTTLNHFLQTDEHKVQLGDASTVFWADSSEEIAEGVFSCFFGAKTDQSLQSQKVQTILEKMSKGRPMEQIRPNLPEGVRFYVLGLAPNAARLSIRFWVEDDFTNLVERFHRHYQDMRLSPEPHDEQPSIWRCLLEVAPKTVKDKGKNIPPQLAGDMLRAILTGRNYPQTLLATILMRLRSDKAITGLRVALLKAVISRKRRMTGHLTKEDFLVSLDPTNADPGYLLGRLFACFEYVQTQALGGSVNATICDKYYGAASATPRSVFPILQRNAMHHLSRVRRDRPGTYLYLDRELTQIYGCAAPEALYVPTLSMDQQAFFAVGYYHQKNAFYTSRNEGTNKKENEE